MSREISVRFKALSITEHNRGFWIGLFLSFTFSLLLSMTTISHAENGKTRMVVLGDSLVAGYGLGPGEAFPEQLQRLINEARLPVLVENAGVSGDTTSGGLARLNWSIGDDVELVLIELGANDALRGLSPEVTRQNLEEMIGQLQARNIGVMLAGMLAPPNMGENYENEFNAIYPELAEKYNVPLYPFFLDGVAAEASLNQADGIHPTAEGVKIIVDKFFPFFKTALAQLTAS